ncbi:MAG: gamma-glutamylcyclotransferase family protein [Verrucomicrobiota bacterium]
MNVFVYGTLLVPRIWDLVTECPQLRSSEARLEGHSIWRVHEATFPAIRKEEEGYSGSVPGRIFFDVPANALQRLDLYEDAFYERVAVDVQTEEGCFEAEVYRAPADKADAIVSEDTWTLKWFEENGLERFLENVFGH